MKDEDALKELSELFPNREFRIQRDDHKVRIYRGRTPYTVQNSLDECMGMARWYAIYLKGGPRTLREFQQAKLNYS
jgi:hypothetical protein